MIYLPLITKNNARHLITLFDIAFRHGVIHASEVADDYKCREWVAKIREDHTFGLVNCDWFMDWREWRYTLSRWCRYNRIYTLAESCLDKIKHMNYAWAILPLCMDFYIMGVEEWLSYPNERDLDAFKSRSRIHWKDIEHKMKRIRLDDYIAYAQGFAYERIRSEADLPTAPSAISYNSLCQMIWQYTRKK